MKKNNSPWLYQLRNNRITKSLNKDEETDIAIIGAGIAGISTAFFILKYTNRKVLMLERYKTAHGATGHNAGQVVSYFERGFASLVEEFGIDLAVDAQKAIEDAWQLMDEMYTEAGLNIPYSRFLGHAGLSSYEQIIIHLKNNLFRKKGGLNPERIVISKEVGFLKDIPAEYLDLYTTAPREEILSMLETKSKDFIAMVSYQKGCINSALFCEEVVLYLIRKYEERFSLCEDTPISKIILRNNEAILDAIKHTVKATKVVLCTNGFGGFTIINEGGLEINTKFHHMLQGTIGYMSGYLEKMNKNPTAISYLTSPDSDVSEPYFYLTRRYYEYEGDKDFNLISIGGPEHILEDNAHYSHEHEYSEEFTEKIDDFVKNIYDTEPNKNINYAFTWHGLMGYTKNGIRLIGYEPKNPILMYNLGCNGVGILPSVYGGKRISESIGGKELGKSIFDVPDEYKK